jgi:YD repeat-containing protein
MSRPTLRKPLRPTTQVFLGLALGSLLVMAGWTFLAPDSSPLVTCHIDGPLQPVTGPISAPLEYDVSSLRRPHQASCFIRVKITKETTYPDLDPTKPPITIRTPQRWLGSGVLIDADQRLILTNWHVADDNGKVVNREYRIIFPEGEELKGAFVASDKSKDLALLQVVSTRPLGRQAVALSDMGPQLGQGVYVIGCPYGLAFSISSGTLSMTGREVRIRMRYDKQGRRIGGRIRIGHRTTAQVDPGYVVYHNMIQVDAPINPGNSGGGLFNSWGRLIGLVNSGMQADGLGFAIPMTTIKKFLADHK